MTRLSGEDSRAALAGKAGVFLVADLGTKGSLCGCGTERRVVK